MAIKEKDKIIEVNTLEIPEELKELPQWVLWRAEWNDKKQEFKKYLIKVEVTKLVLLKEMIGLVLILFIKFWKIISYIKDLDLY